MKEFLFLLVVFFAPSFICIGQIPAFQFTHKGSVLHVKFSPDGSKLLSYSSGNQDMAMWDVRKARLLWKRPISFIQKIDDYYTLNALTWSPDGRLIATGSGNGTVQLWDVQSGAFIWMADIAKKDISALVFSPDGKTIAAVPYSGETNAAKLLDVATGDTVKVFAASQCTQVAVAFDSQGNELKIGNLDGNVGIWDIASGKPLEGHGASCRTMLAYGGERSFSEDLSLSVRKTTAEDVVIEESSGKVIRTNKLNDSRMSSVINSKAKLAVLGEYGGYHLYNLASGENRILNDGVSGSAFDLSADGRLFAQSCDGSKTAIKVTNLGDGQISLLDGHPSTIHAITYSPDYSLLAVAGNDGNAYLLDPATKTVRKVLEGNGLRLTALTFSSDGNTLVTGDENGVLHQWDVQTRKLVKETKLNDRSDEIEKIDISKDEKTVIVLSNHDVIILDHDLGLRGHLNTVDGYSQTSGEMTFTSTSV
ncbi:MAG: WD40 repeat domain-containing protein, partial [Acidobacteriota bacterium]